MKKHDYFDLTLKEYMELSPEIVSQDKIVRVVIDMGKFTMTDDEIMEYQLNMMIPVIRNDKDLGFYIDFDVNTKLEKIFIERYVFLKYFELVYGETYKDEIQYRITKLNVNIVSRFFPKREMKSIKTIDPKFLSPENPYLLKQLLTNIDNNNKTLLADLTSWEDSMISCYNEPYRFSEILAVVKAGIMKKNNKYIINQLASNLHSLIEQESLLSTRVFKYWLDRIKFTIEAYKEE